MVVTVLLADSVVVFAFDVVKVAVPFSFVSRTERWSSLSIIFMENASFSFVASCWTVKSEVRSGCMALSIILAKDFSSWKCSLPASTTKKVL